MQAIILIGIPASGKSTFYKERFVDTHVRINQDMLKTRNRQRLLFEFCLSTEQPCVIDNTNINVADRAIFIKGARERQFDVTGYFFQSKKAECYKRNLGRSGVARVPDVAIYSKISEMELPTINEGFAELNFVKIGERGFEVSPWVQ